MIYIVDGTNFLGVMGRNRESDEEKRALLKFLGDLARSEGATIECVFDGSQPDAFAVSLGAVRARFAYPKSADDLIADLAQRAPGGRVHVVTSDLGLAARVRRRKVVVVDCRSLASKASSSAPAAAEFGGDWESYFSDPKNRNV